MQVFELILRDTLFRTYVVNKEKVRWCFAECSQIYELLVISMHSLKKDNLKMFFWKSFLMEKRFSRSIKKYAVVNVLSFLEKSGPCFDNLIISWEVEEIPKFL